jgi:hypothetical protein
MPPTATDFSAHREGSTIRVVGTVTSAGRGWAADLVRSATDIDHDPTGLRLALSPSGSTGDAQESETAFRVEELFDVAQQELTHVVIRLRGGIEADRYSGDSLNIPIG